MHLPQLSVYAVYRAQEDGEELVGEQGWGGEKGIEVRPCPLTPAVLSMQ
jgi:hypothetical protein